MAWVESTFVKMYQREKTFDNRLYTIYTNPHTSFNKRPNTILYQTSI